ncbi:MAG: 23S rRNA (adenine(2503)-C(2))-methyltransferase RlmN [Bifidobacteriaceae bacterium]|nr:23S rRNA (adenine(2503)-C(2))-methyltransferase RlmN [Bifidobacteriaceae bacterium]
MTESTTHPFTNGSVPAARGANADDEPETGITPGGTQGAFRDVLSKDHARRAKAPTHFADMDREERIEAAKAIGLPKFRVDQLARHYYAHFETDVESFTDFPQASREAARHAFFPRLIDEELVQTADNGTTRKTLWKLFDGSRIESVLMKYPSRITLCISSQVGCGMGCPFCATGHLGLTRNLSCGEILEQVRCAANASAGGVFGEPDRLSNVVFMGMGEPMGNYRSVVRAIRQICGEPPTGFGISARNITVSTVGVVPGIRKLIDEKIPVRLAVSLHAPNDELRSTLVPMNKRFNIEQVLDAAHDYYLSSHRRVSIEYALMRGINDQPEHARQLARRLNHYGDDWVHVNPIPLNPIEGSPWTASKPEDEAAFLDILHHAGITATLRDTRGSDIDGACGQLAARHVADQVMGDSGAKGRSGAPRE